MNKELSILPDSQELVRQSTDIASLCKEIVIASSVTIQGRKYVRVEGWQAIATAHGCVASARDVKRVEGGMSATGEIRRMQDGQLIATAEGFVGEDEATWYGGRQGNKTLPKRAEYAIRAMAQTRAISRACRGCFAHVVVLMKAGLSTTPAEEVPEGGFNDNNHESESSEPTVTITEEEEYNKRILKLRNEVLAKNNKTGHTPEDFEEIWCGVISVIIGDGHTRTKLEGFTLDQLRGVAWEKRVDALVKANEMKKEVT